MVKRSIRNDQTSPSKRNKENGFTLEENERALEEIAKSHSGGDEDESMQESNTADNEEDDEDIDWEHVEIHHDNNSRTVELPKHVEVSYVRGQVKKETKPKRNPAKQSVTREMKFQRMFIHLIHLQALIAHGYLRNQWINDNKLQKSLRKRVPKVLRKACKKYQKHVAATKISSEKLREELLAILYRLAVFIKSKFKVTHPALRRQGFVKKKESDNSSTHHNGECISDFAEFRQKCLGLSGSLDLGAQLFTCILRALGFQVRLIFSPPALGLGFTKLEEYVEIQNIHEHALENSPKVEVDVDGSSDESGEDEEEVYIPPVKSITDKDITFPNYWTEIYDDLSETFFPVDAFIQCRPFAEDPIDTKPEYFEPQGTLAGRLRMHYVLGYDHDCNVKNLTPKYMSFKNLPQIPETLKLSTPPRILAYNFFLQYIELYSRRRKAVVSEVDEVEDAKLKEWSTPPQGTKDIFPSSLSAYKEHDKYVLDSQLRKDQALLPNCKLLHTFTITNSKTKVTRTEKVYLLKDVVSCRSETAWFKEGRAIKEDEHDKPLKKELKKPSTKMGQRKFQSSLKYNENENLEQGLYAFHQTKQFRHPDIIDGIVPRNEFGSIECFQPHMVPRNGVHLRYKGMNKVAKKLGIDFAPAIVGFTFQSRYARPDIDGIVVSVEAKELLIDAWNADQAYQLEQDAIAMRQRAFQKWRVYVVKLRLLKRLHDKYGIVPEEKSHPKNSDQGPVEEIGDNNEINSGSIVVDAHHNDNRNAIDSIEADSDNDGPGGFL